MAPPHGAGPQARQTLGPGAPQHVHDRHGFDLLEAQGEQDQHAGVTMGPPVWRDWDP
ncbi:MAG: hypothetical protein IPK67_14335 [Planctomycetes bacterium]|nr:hypothetical protein [Planctomycetota bacterium]